MFRLLPGLDRRHTPCSDHLFEVLKPLLDELLFLGSEYERAFDIFEVLYAIEYAFQSDRGWGPVGRFGWKGVRGDSVRAFASSRRLKPPATLGGR